MDENDRDYYERTYALTPQGDPKTLLETVVLDRRDYRDHNDTAAVLQRALAQAQETGESVDVHAHNQWWSPIYTIAPDGSGYRHATGRKAGSFQLT